MLMSTTCRCLHLRMGGAGHVDKISTMMSILSRKRERFLLLVARIVAEVIATRKGTMAQLIRSYLVRRLADNYLAAVKSENKEDVIRAKNDVRTSMLNLEEVKLFDSYVSQKA